MPQTQLVLNVHGGLVQDIFCSDDSADVVIVDWDVEPENASDEGVVSVVRGDRTVPAIVANPNVRPLFAISGTDVEAAIEVACKRGILNAPNG